MPNFPLIKNQAELNQHLEKIKVDLAGKHKGLIKHHAKSITRTHGNSLVPHELSKLQKLFEGRDLTISAIRAK